MNSPDPITELDTIIARARAAQQLYESEGSQARYDRAAQAAAWAIMEPERNRILAELAVDTTGLGNVPDKILKNHRKTLGLMRDIKDVTTFGVIRDDAETGLTEIARPMGVVGAILVVRWAKQLLGLTTGVLLDQRAEPDVRERLREAI